MRIVVVHNHYRSPPRSGEDHAFESEVSMLQRRGHDVYTFERFNNDIHDSRLIDRVALARSTIWSGDCYSELRSLIRNVRPNIMHVHNTFPQISLSAYWASDAEGIPLVQTLHNYRFFCASGLFLRDGLPCEDCVGGGLSHAVRHRCYRDSATATAVVVASIAFHRALNSFSSKVNRYIALTEFSAKKFVKSGLPADRVVVKPNVIPNPPLEGDGSGDYAAFAGRLSEEKGIRTLVSAWNRNPGIPLIIAGDGPLLDQLRRESENSSQNVTFLGQLDRDGIEALLQHAKFTVVPSECYEGLPYVVAESFACGTPVVASRIGSLEELVKEGETGALFEPGDPIDLIKAISRILSDEARLLQMRKQARLYFDEYFTEDENYRQLMKIYASAM